MSTGVTAEETPKFDDPPSARTLESLVSELLRLDLEESKEKTAWHEQRGKIDAMIALLQAEKQRLEKAVKEFENKEDTERTERERLANRISEMKAALSGIAQSAADAGRDMLAEYEKLPPALQESLRTGAQVVRARLDERASPENAVGRLRTVVAFSHDMQRILSEIHAVKEILAFEDSRRVEVDVLYLGGAVGFYLAPDRKHAGILRPSGGRWTRESRDEIAPQVALALEVTRKETPPRLVALPVSPGDASEQERGEGDG
jgi:hypothetical protein